WRYSSAAMRIAAIALVVLSRAGSALAQRPSDPALLVPQEAPAMDYVAVPTAVTLPDGVTMDATAHLWVLTRGAVAFFEFDDKGTHLRSFRDKLFTRAHGLRIDRDGNLWAGDVGAHTVRKFSRNGQV